MTLNVRVFTSDGSHQDFALQCCNVTPEYMLSRFIGHLKEQFPRNEFRAVKVGKKRYNVIPLALGNA